MLCSHWPRVVAAEGAQRRRKEGVRKLLPMICSVPQDCNDFLSKSLFIMGEFYVRSLYSSVNTFLNQSRCRRARLALSVCCGRERLQVA
ncbi:hypothetical protein BHE74_00034055 [Ensete ventricosum]|nr:hypothetical protein BHE74_00034055 [Ensete ventricosum]